MSDAINRIIWGGSDYDKERYQAKKNELIALLGGICAKCESIENLEFDHIDPTTKLFSIMSIWNRAMDVILPELRKCQLLCIDCHKQKTGSTRRTVPHGGGVRGKGGCNCGPCKSKKAEYMKANKYKWR